MAKEKPAPVAKSPAARTTASIFVNGFLDADEAPVVLEPAEKPAEFPEIPPDTNLPVKLLYQFQDFVNDNLTFVKGVQCLVVLYLGQILYLFLARTDNNDAMYTTAFNILGCLLAMGLAYRAQKRKHDEQPDTYAAPVLPGFNILYSIFVPMLLVLLMADLKGAAFQANLALNNFAARSLHPIAKVLSSFVFYYMYNEAQTLELVQFVKVLWIYFSIEYALSTWNESCTTDYAGNVVVATSMSDPEIHFVAVACVNVLVYLELLPLTENTIPLYIVRCLVLSLVIACAVSYPLYELYKYLGSSALASAVSVVVVGVSCGSFYYATNYQFNMFVAKKEVFLWLFDHITEYDARTKILVSWIVCFLAAIPAMYFLSINNVLSLNMRRKAWHFLLLATLTYPLVQDPQFTALAVLGSSVVFVVTEFLRCTEITFVGGWLKEQLRLFQDEKDLEGPLNLSYIFLLIGTSIPIAYGLAVDDPVSIRSFLGLAALGLGDSAASIVGKKFGKIKWKGGDKKFEGTVAHIVATFAYFVFVDSYVLPEGHRVQNWENLFIVAVIGGVVEGSTSLNDNVLVPAITLIAHEALNRVFPGH